MARTPEQIFYGDAYEHGSIDADILLNYGWARVRVCTPTTSGNAYVLPDARTCPVGADLFFLISEATGGGEDMAVEDDGNNNLATITPTTVARVHLQDNSTADGEWHVEVNSYGSIPAPPDPNAAYFFGGATTTQTLTEFDPDSASWSTKTSNPSGTGVHSAGFDLDDRCYVNHGGLAATAKDFYEYDPDSWSVMTDSGDRHGSSADNNGHTGKDGGSGVSVGIFFCSADDLDGVESYDRDTNTWDSGLADMSTTTRRFAVHAVGNSGNVYSMGGSASVGVPSTQSTVYSISGDSHSSGTVLPNARNVGASTYIGTDMHFLGGITSGAGRIDTHDVYDMAGDSYSTETDLPDAASRGGAINIGDSALVLADGQTDTDTSGGDNVYIFNGSSFVAQTDQPGTSTHHQKYQNATMKAPS